MLRYSLAVAVPIVLVPVARAELLTTTLSSLSFQSTEPASSTTPDLGEPAKQPVALSFNLDEGLKRESAAPATASEGENQPAVDASGRSRAYGTAGSRWWTVGGLYANDFEDAHDGNIHGAFSQFLADDLEFAVEAAVWYFNEKNESGGGRRGAGGVSGSMVFRWHFAHAEDYDWSVFGDVGIGLLGAFDDVPVGGTSFNFLPRIGAGFTKALSSSEGGESTGARLLVGIRYHHISNARIASDTKNPSRDAIAVYAAIVFPF